MPSKVEACAVNGTDDDMAEHGGTIPEKTDEQEVEACTSNGNVGAEHGDGEGEGEAAFAAVMAQLAPEGVRALHARVPDGGGAGSVGTRGARPGGGGAGRGELPQGPAREDAPRRARGRCTAS
jgi:hypothetical protein